MGVVGLGILAACSSGGTTDPTGEADEAATTAEVAKKLFDVNDVSILFPKDSNGEPQPSIKMSDKDGAGSEFFPQGTFDQVIKFAKGGVDGQAATNPRIGFQRGMDDRANWRVVGMRFDPCAPTTKIAGDPVLNAVGITECIVQVRLIAQPIISKRDVDTTAHLVFNLGTKSALEKAAPGSFAALQTRVVNLLRGIRDASATAGAPTVGRTLGVHPGLAKDPANVGTLVRQFIDETAGASSKLEAAGVSVKSVAFMGLIGGSFEPWVFFAGRVVPGTGWQPLPMPAFPASKQMHQKLSFIDSQHVIPVSELPKSTAPLFENSASGGATEAKLAFEIDHPEDIHFFNMDCVSCHTTASRVINLGIKSTSDRHRVPNGITGYVTRENAQGSTWNVRNFGYFGGKPTVSSRTATETVGVVQFMNTEWMDATTQADLKKINDRRASRNQAILQGPARDCTAVDDEVYDCFDNNGSNDDAAESGTGKCTAKCGAFATRSTDTEPEEPPPAPPIDPVVPPVDPPVEVDVCDATPEVAVTVGSDGSATLTGVTAQCLSRTMNGSFRSTPANILCRTTTECKITLRNPQTSGKASSVTFGGAAARRLLSTLQSPVGEDGIERFATKSSDAAAASLKIECKSGRDRSCTVTITSK
ncbi:MAG: hypothetical protein U0169_25565 [Polyangiaceae bacterium]